MLLCLHGTIPIQYRSAHYHIPIAFWLPLNYPESSPMVFVTPTSDMLIQPGKYVDPGGKIHHPQLSYWNNQVRIFQKTNKI